MTVSSFLDTNILVYAAIGTGTDDWKRKLMLKLMLPAKFATSGQVLQEFFVTVTREGEVPLSIAKEQLCLHLSPLANIRPAALGSKNSKSLRICDLTHPARTVTHNLRNCGDAR